MEIANFVACSVTINQRPIKKFIFLIQGNDNYLLQFTPENLLGRFAEINS